MSGRVVHLGFALAFVAALEGCAVGNQLVAPHDEYRLYRTMHLAPTLEGRLAAANRYLHVAPDGAYAPEVKTWFKSAEQAYLVRAHDRLPMLNAYAQSLPDGPSIAEVTARIDELKTTAAFNVARVQRQDERVESIEAGLERASAQRKAFIAELSDWLGVLAAVRSFGQPTSALPPALTQKLGLGDPATACPLDLCVKSFAPRFAIPREQGQLIPREAPYSIEIQLANGAVAALRLRGRELFSRIGEALDLRPVSFADPQSRAEAIGRALSLVGNGLGPTLGAATCEKPAVSPVVLDHACDGVHVTVTAAVDAGDDDHVDFTPEAPPAPPAPPTPPKKH
ncbi:MAG TPA: hypothetical protein VFV94_01460 [Polyangiaceae bacterium]|nr:hypothetical protein [Polyangiaceae bacterium]